MKIPIKTPQQIQIMKQGGYKLGRILGQLVKMAQPGVNLLDIEKKAMVLIKKTGGEAGFARVPNYHWATCLNINEEIVHGVPKDYLLKSGDVLNIDIGLYYRGFNTDMSSTIYIKNPRHPELVSRSIKKFLSTGKKALQEAIKQAQPGNRVGHISQKIQEIIEGAGYSCARTLTGHGIGKQLHQPPSIPCFLRDSIEETPILKEKMALAIEVIYCLGKPELVIDPQDRWTIRTKDGRLTAVFEKTIAVTEKGPVIITPFEGKESHNI